MDSEKIFKQISAKFYSLSSNKQAGIILAALFGSIILLGAIFSLLEPSNSDRTYSNSPAESYTSTTEISTTTTTTEATTTPTIPVVPLPYEVKSNAANINDYGTTRTTYYVLISPIQRTSIEDRARVKAIFKELVATYGKNIAVEVHDDSQSLNYSYKSIGTYEKTLNDQERSHVSKHIVANWQGPIGSPDMQNQIWWYVTSDTDIEYDYYFAT